MKLSANFSLAELTKSQTASRKGIDNTPSEEAIANLRLVCENILQPVRDHYGIPFSPNSGYRGPELNAAIGGSSRSQHMTGQAVDFEVPTISNFDLATWVRENLEFDQLILECYQPGVPKSGWVHCSYIGSNQRGAVLTYSGGQYSNGLIA